MNRLKWTKIGDKWIADMKQRQEYGKNAYIELSASGWICCWMFFFYKSEIETEKNPRKKLCHKINIYTYNRPKKKIRLYWNPFIFCGPKTFRNWPFGCFYAFSLHILFLVCGSALENVHLAINTGLIKNGVNEKCTFYRDVKIDVMQKKLSKWEKTWWWKKRVRKKVMRCDNKNPIAFKCNPSIFWLWGWEPENS